MIIDLDNQDPLTSVQMELRIINPDRLPDLKNMRHNGHRWVDAEHEDRPFVPIIRQEQPGKDMFGGTGRRTPARPKKVRKTRRRGPLSE